MSSIRSRSRSDGTVAHAVLFRHEGIQCTKTFEDYDLAVRWRKLLDRIGPDEAIRVLEADRPKRNSLTVTEWFESHTKLLTGIEEGTRKKYQAYIANDITPAFGELALEEVTHSVIAEWVLGMEEAGVSGKTISNKHGFAYAAFQRAVKHRPPLIPANPCDDTSLPPHHHEPVFLEPEEFEVIRTHVPERWAPMVLFLVTTGVRFSECTALTVADVDSVAMTLRVSKAWKYTGGAAKLGGPKTRKGIRTINIPAEALAVLDLERRNRSDLLFTTRDGNRITSQNFHNNCWQPAMRQLADVLGKKPRVHDLRHTCASWMLNAGVPLPTVSSHLGHENIQTTVNVYGHLDRKAGTLAASAISQALSGMSVKQ